MKIFHTVMSGLLLVLSVMVVVLIVSDRNPWPVIVAYWLITAFRNGLDVIWNTSEE